MKIYFLVFLLFICVACCNKQERQSYIVASSVYNIDTTENLYPVFYGDFNFVLDDTHIYYFQHENKKLYCGNCNDSDANKPPFLDLTPNSLRKVESENLLYFLNTLNLENNKKIVIVLSPTDTIKNKSLHTIKKFFSDKKVLVGIQKCTEESFFVYQAKRLNKPYNPRKIQWKHGFNESLPWDQKGMDKNEIDSFDF